MSDAGSLHELFEVLRPGFGRELVDGVPEGTPLGGASGAALVRLRLADGRSVVRKTISPSTDWMMRATNDRGRAALLPLEGWMRHLPPGTDDGVIAIARSGETWDLYLEDLTDAFRRPKASLTDAVADDAMRRMGTMHEAYLGVDVPHLASMLDLLRLSSPRTLERVDQSHPFIAHARRGWELFADAAPPDLASFVLGVDDDAVIAPLVRRLEAAPRTLVHADLHFGNMAFDGDRLVIVDWSLATAAPAAVDFVWFLDRLAGSIDVDGDDWVERYLRRDDPTHDEATLDVCFLVELIVAGWLHGHRLTGGTSSRRDWYEQWSTWWTERARRGLASLS